MRYICTICLVLVFGFLQISCNQSNSTEKAKVSYPAEDFTQRINQLKSANVADDVNIAIQKGDLRFLVCVGFAGVVPGMPQWSEELYKKYGTRILDGTGDMIMSNEQKTFKELAASYAEAYNKLLWAKIQKGN
jgi:hypothetical protein